MRPIIVLIALVLAGPAAAEESGVQQKRYAVLGQFAGLVVACGVATEDEASQMVRRLSANFDQPWPKASAAKFEAARARGRKADCSDAQLRDGVEKGWGNYTDVK